MADALVNLGTVALDRGDYTRSAALFDESLSLSRELGDTWSIATVLSNLGEVAEEEGEYGKAAAFYQESLDLYRDLGEKRGIALLTGRLKDLKGPGRLRTSGGVVRRGPAPPQRGGR
jgi:tetratricopeptide (TPR) repeat protein